MLLSFKNVSPALQATGPLCGRTLGKATRPRAGPATRCLKPPVLSCLHGTVFRNPDNGLCSPAGASLCFSTSYLLYKLQIDSVLGGGWGGSYGWRETLPYFVKSDQGSWLSLPPAESIIRTLFFPAVFRQRKIFWFCHLKSTPFYLECGSNRRVGSHLLSGWNPCRCEKPTCSRSLLGVYTIRRLSPSTSYLLGSSPFCIPFSSTHKWSWLVVSLQKDRELVCSACD